MRTFLSRHRKSTVGRLLLFYSLYSVFSNCINPITPAIFLELGFPDYMFGVGYAAMAGACFLFSPIWGKLCGTFGYTKILGFSFLSYALVQTLFSVSSSQAVIILCRFLGGVSYSASLVAGLAYLIAVAPADKKHKLMLYYSAATTAGTAIGYAVGGFIGTISIALTFRFQIISLLLLFVSLLCFMKDPDKADIPTRSPARVQTQKSRHRGVFAPLFFITVFLASFATTGYDNAYNYYVKEALNFLNYYNGLIRAGIGLITLGMTLTVGTWVAKKFDLRLSLVPVLIVCGAIAYGVCFLSVPLIFVMGNFLYYASNALYLPFQQGILSDVGKDCDSGYISGLFNSLHYAGRVLGALFAGFIYGFGSKLPFVASAAIFLVAALFALADYIHQRRTSDARSVRECSVTN